MKPRYFYLFDGTGTVVLEGWTSIRKWRLESFDHEKNKGELGLYTEKYGEVVWSGDYLIIDEPLTIKV